MGNDVSMDPIKSGMSEKKYRKVVKQSNEAIGAVGVDGFWFMNETFAKMYGYNSAAAMEKAKQHPGKLSPPTQPDGMESPAKAELLIKKVMTSPVGRYDFDWEHVTVHGSPFSCHVWLSVLQLKGKVGCQAIVRYRDDSSSEIDEALLLAKRIDNTNTDGDSSSDTGSQPESVNAPSVHAGTLGLKADSPLPNPRARNDSGSVSSRVLKDRTDSDSMMDLSEVDSAELDELMLTVGMLKNLLLRMDDPKLVGEANVLMTDLSDQIEATFVAQEAVSKKKLDRLQERLKRERQMSNQRCELLESNLNKRLRALESTKSTQDTTAKDLKKMKAAVNKTQTGLDEIIRKTALLSSGMNQKKARSNLKRILQELKDDEGAAAAAAEENDDDVDVIDGEDA